MALFNWFKKSKNKEVQEDTDLQEELQEEIQGEPQAEIIEDVQDEIQAEVLEDVQDEIQAEILEDVQQEPQAEVLEDVQDEIQAEILEDVQDEITEEIQQEPQEKPKKEGFFQKIKKGLAKTRDNLLSGVEQALSTFTKIDEELFEELEEVLIMSDIGVDTSMFIMSEVRKIVKLEKIQDVSAIKDVIARVITSIMEEDNTEFELKNPAVLLIIGVNGVGKTTTIGKLCNLYKQEGRKVILGAGDTFRAAAIDQLQVWGDRNSVDVIKHQENSDPAAVVFDAIKASKARNADLLICDTAGRLHNKKNLMEELKKISKIVTREYEEAQVETLLVLDATTGQNALQQAKLFSEVADITGLVLTKLDGTAKGGVIISIKNQLNIPVRFIGVGEQLEDLRPFDASEFAKALFD